jgi:hypothetical protein
MPPDIVHIGAGAGFAGDRAGAALPVVEALAAASQSNGGKPSFLIFETLAERTLALAQLTRRWSRCSRPSWPSAYSTASVSSAISAPPIRRPPPARSPR